MTHTDIFGVSLVFDQPTGYIILKTKSTELAHFVSSAILDTATHLFANVEGRIVNYPAAIDAGRLRIVTGLVSSDPGPLPQTVKGKKERADLIYQGAVFLFSQSAIIGTSYDGFDFLSTEDLPLYYLHKQKYVEAYVEIHNSTVAEATRHLDFLAENLVIVSLRKKAFIQHYAASLKAVVSQAQYDEWYERVWNGAVGFGRV